MPPHSLHTTIAPAPHSTLHTCPAGLAPLAAAARCAAVAPPPAPCCPCDNDLPIAPPSLAPDPFSAV